MVYTVALFVKKLSDKAQDFQLLRFSTTFVTLARDQPIMQSNVQGEMTVTKVPQKAYNMCPRTA